MQCPRCSYPDTKITDSRLSLEGLMVRRRRVCEKCSYRFTTNESREILDVMVIKRNGDKERYSSTKLMKGLTTALHKRPFTQHKIRDLRLKIETELFKRDPREVTTRQIGNIVLKYLKNFDEVAYIRFASIYRDFKTIKGFTHEIDKLLQNS